MATSLLQKVQPKIQGKSNWGAGAQPQRTGEAAATNPVAITRTSNFGAGQQPDRRPVGQANPTPAAPRNLGTMTSADLERSPTGSPLTVKPKLTGARPTSGYSEYSAKPSVLTRTPPTAVAAVPVAPTPAAPVAAPTTVAAQQTESANPLSGDTNQAAGGTTQAVRSPAQAMGFGSRGGGTPAGQDATASIGQAMQSTQANIGGTGLYRRSFSNPKSASLYNNAVRRLFPENTV